MPTTQVRGASAGNSQIKAGSISNPDIAAAAAIALSKLANGNLIILADGTVTFSNNLNMGNFRIINVGDPTVPQDAATKAYVDSVASGLRGKASVKAASIANLTLSGTQTVDGVVLVANDRILVKDQTTASQNGLYTVQSGAWVRATDMDNWLEVPAAFVFVEGGTVNADRAYLCTNDQGGTLNTTNITWVQFGSGGGLGSGNFVTNETSAGLINGSNTAFPLAFTPFAGSETVYLNGILQIPGAGNDYTISGSTVTMLTAPITGDTLRFQYMK